MDLNILSAKIKDAIMCIRGGNTDSGISILVGCNQFILKEIEAANNRDLYCCNCEHWKPNNVLKLRGRCYELGVQTTFIFYCNKYQTKNMRKM